MRVLILYTELAGYVLGNIRRFISANPGAEVLLVHYPVNAEAPFNLATYPHTRFIEFSSGNIETIHREVSAFNPDAVLCSGWGNKAYLEIVRSLGAGTKRVLCFDNKWKGTLKQYVLVALSRVSFLRMFKYAWVPGEPQRDYALRLGFKKENVFTGLYPADTDFFIPIGKKKLAVKSDYPRTMISVARYIPQKDLPTLWRAFINANVKTGNTWKLQCFGLGELYESRVQDPFIQHIGFKQPHEMEQYILGAGVYVLPSIEEPWGVAVHEMALSAMPLVLSDKVGAGSMFLTGRNGFSFSSGDEKELEGILSGIMTMNDAALWRMAEESYSSGMQLTSDDWSETLRTIVSGKRQ